MNDQILNWSGGPEQHIVHSMLKRILFGLAALFILLLTAVFVLPSLVPTDSYRDKLEEELSRAMARDVTIDGDIRISTFPAIEVETGAVNLANPEGFGRENFVEMQGLTARIKLWPLISKRVEISRVIVDTPDIWLERKANGQANWTSPEINTEPAETTEGPFLRDGRFTEYDPSLALLRIKDGSLRFQDAQDPQNTKDISLSEIEFDLNAPGLNKAMKFEGSLLTDGEPVSLEGNFDTPKTFLTGQVTPFALKLSTYVGEIAAKGSFRETELLAFDAKLDSSSSAPMVLAERLPLPSDLILPKLDNFAAGGDISFDGEVISSSDFDLNASGDALSASYKGNFSFADEPAADGAFDVTLNDTSLINNYVDQPIKGIELIQGVKASGNVNLKNGTVSLRKILANVTGDEIKASFEGAANLGDAISATGNFSSKLGNPAKLAETFAPEFTQASLVGPTELSGALEMAGDQINIPTLSVTTKGETLDGTFSGSVTSSPDGVSAAGPFDVIIGNMAEFVKAAGVEQPDAAALGRVQAKGSLHFTPAGIAIQNLTTTATEGLANGSFEGNITSLEPLSIEGQVKADIASLAALDAAIPREIAYSDMIGEIGFSTNIQTRGETYVLSALSAALAGGKINGEFSGQAEISDTQKLDGTLALDITDLRAIADASGTVLPPNTDKGEIFQTFKVAGDVSGTTEKLSFADGTITLDDLTARGDFDLVLTGERPRLTGEVAFETLDTRPYMAAYSAQKPQGQIVPWSTTPMNLSGLSALDSDLTFTAPGIQLTRLEIGQINATASLKNGVFTLNIPAMSLYGGSGLGTLTLDAPNGLPRVRLDAEVSAVSAKEFASASSGFDKVTGTAGLKFSTTGQGASQADIMRSLSGNGSFQVENGSLLGINAEALLSGIDTAITNRQVPQALGLGETTEFKDLDGTFTLTNGQVNLGSFALESGNLSMEGDGSVNMGDQNLDFGLRPKLKDGSDVASFGVPLRFQGAFGQAKAGLDTSMLTQIATAKARQSAGAAIQDQIGGTFGDILGGVIGGSSTTTEESAPEDTQTDEVITEKETVPAETTETTVEETASDTQTPDTPTTEDEASEATQTESETETISEQDAEQATEEQVEELLKGLFGKKKDE